MKAYTQSDAELRGIRSLIETGEIDENGNKIGAINVGGAGVLITPSITVDTAAYIANDCIGGKITLPNAVRSDGGISFLQSLHLLDRSNQKPALEIIIFDSNPAAATLTDNAAFNAGADDLKEIARISVAATDWVTVNTKARATIAAGGIMCKAASGTTLYAAIVAVGAPDFVAATDLQIRFGFIYV